MTAVQAAEARLEAYVAEIVLRRDSLDLVKFKRLEYELERAAMHQVGPF
jgi:hypothetical protein